MPYTMTCLVLSVLFTEGNPLYTPYVRAIVGHSPTAYPIFFLQACANRCVIIRDIELVCCTMNNDLLSFLSKVNIFTQVEGHMFKLPNNHR